MIGETFDILGIENASIGLILNRNGIDNKDLVMKCFILPDTGC